MTKTASKGPLSGVRILDLTSIVLGPLATLTLAGLGAEIIKIEAPGGDNVRNAGVMKNSGMGHVFLHGNRGKKSVVLDLKNAMARDALLKLVATSDVFFTNVRSSAMNRLGLDYGALRAINPRIIYVVASGYGSKGPYSDKPAYDDLIQGAAGIPWLMQQYTGGEPAYVPLSLADRIAGLHAVYAISAALYAREKTGEGQLVEVPMFESVAHFVLADHAAGKTFMPPQGDAGYDRLLSQDRRPYKTADGYLCVLIYNDKHWKRLFEGIGTPDVFNDERFCSQMNRSRNIRAVYRWVADLMKTKSTLAWEKILNAADIPNQRINSIDDLLEDPHLMASGLVSAEQHPTEGMLRALGSPTSWSATPTGPIAPAPMLGEQSHEILSEIGYVTEDIEAMQRSSLPVKSKD